VDENNVAITWDTPENENGVLLYYNVSIYNQLRNYSESVSLMPDDRKSVSFDGLGKTYRNYETVHYWGGGGWLKA
jgi:hypothetical protein